MRYNTPHLPWSLVCALALYVPSLAAYEGHVYPGWGKVPAQAVDVSVLSAHLRYTGQISRFCQITAYTWGEKQEDGYPFHYYYVNEPIQYSDKGNTFSCMGYKWDRRTAGRDDLANIGYQIVNSVRVPYKSSGTHPGPAGGDAVAGKCWFQLLIYSEPEGLVMSLRPPEAGAFDCTAPVVTEPVACSIIVAEAIEHAPKTVGMIDSVAYGQLEVECSADAIVTVSTPDQNTALTAGNDQILSKTYVQNEGQYKSKIWVGPRARVDLINVINTHATNPGRFLGASVVMIEWD